MRNRCACRQDLAWLATVRKRLILAASIIILGMSHVAARAGADGQGLLRFDIPRQSLASALDSYSAATGIVGLYRGQLAVGRISKPVAGHYTPETALRLLLRETGLAAQYASADAFTLLPSGDIARSSGSATVIARAAIAQQDAIQRDYSALLQERITAALCANGATRPADYRIALSFRVGTTGEIEQFDLLGSSGDSSRDEAIARTLRTLGIGRPAPSHMSQPFTMVVLPASSGGAVNCPPIRSALHHG